MPPVLPLPAVPRAAGADPAPTASVLTQQRRALDLVGWRADAVCGRRLGRVSHVLVEWRTGRPRWGLITPPGRTHGHAVPVEGVVAGAERVFVPQDHARVLAGPPIPVLERHHVVADHALRRHFDLPAAASERHGICVELEAEGVWSRRPVLAEPAGADAPSTRVFLCDDSAAFRRLLRITLELEPDLEVVGEAGDGLAAAKALPGARPDVVLLDLGMPVLDGLTAMPLLHSAAPDAAIIGLSGFGGGDLPDRLRDRGAAAFLPKGTDLNEVVAAVRHRGRTVAAAA